MNSRDILNMIALRDELIVKLSLVLNKLELVGDDALVEAIDKHEAITNYIGSSAKPRSAPFPSTLPYDAFKIVRDKDTLRFCIFYDGKSMYEEEFRVRDGDTLRLDGVSGEINVSFDIPTIYKDSSL